MAGDVYFPPQIVAEALRRARQHTDELMACGLPIAGGETVQIVCVDEVEDWLTSLASRVENEGLKLRASD